MNTLLPLNALRTLSLVAALAAGTTGLHAKSEPPRGAAADALATRGTISVSAAGRQVQRGTFKIQVSTQLGRPDDILADGTWLYEKRSLAGGRTKGTLLVRFADGRVSDLQFATPAAVAALRESLQRDDAKASSFASTQP